MSNAGPLTTIFTAPASCGTATGLYQIWEASESYYYEQGPLTERTECYPSGYNASSPARYYSPGLCPSGYTAACSSTSVISGTATETAHTCCPTAVEYTCAGSANGSAPSRPYLGCTTTFGQAWVVAQATAISGGSTYSAESQTEAAGTGLGANSVAVRFRSGDFNATSSGASSGLETASATAPPPTSTSASSSSSPRSAGSTSLDSKAIAGIGVGSAVGAFFLAGFLYLSVWLRRRKKQQQHAMAPPSLPVRITPPRPPLLPPPPPPPKDYYLGFHTTASPEPGPDGGGISKTAPAASLRDINAIVADGPFELGTSEEKEKEKDKRLYELYGGGEGQWKMGTTPPPPSDSTYGHQPAELESHEKTWARGHRRVPSSRFGRSWAPAELASSP